jgi:hypothetical protein
VDTEYILHLLKIGSKPFVWHSSCCRNDNKTYLKPATKCLKWMATTFSKHRVTKVIFMRSIKVITIRHIFRLESRVFGAAKRTEAGTTSTRYQSTITNFLTSADIFKFLTASISREITISSLVLRGRNFIPHLLYLDQFLSRS